MANILIGEKQEQALKEVNRLLAHVKLLNQMLKEGNTYYLASETSPKAISKLPLAEEDARRIIQREKETSIKEIRSLCSKNKLGLSEDEEMEITI